jgi:hypothetical protein
MRKSVIWLIKSHYLSSVCIVSCLLANSVNGWCDEPPAVVDASTLRHKIMCGYQGWFNCPGDGANLGWVHWSKTAQKLTPGSVHVDYWPDMTEYTKEERYSAPGFTYPDGSQAELYSPRNEKTVLRHFEWMQEYGIDGVWLQRFAVDLPGCPVAARYDALMTVMNNVRAAATKTGRVWAISYDIAQLPTDKMYDAVTADWKKLVDDKVTADPRYLHEGGLPVVQIWGYYYKNDNNYMTAEAGNKLIDFFSAPGPYHAVLAGGGDWGWRKIADPEWQKMVRRFKVWSPWNVGNRRFDAQGVQHANTRTWAEDKQACDRSGTFWLPVVYAGFSWNNLKGKPWESTTFPRRKGNFLWEQFHELSKMGVDTVYLAMFDEMDEGTAILKVTNTPPVQARFLTYEGMPSDWYMRLVGLGEKMLREKTPVSAEIPITGDGNPITKQAVAKSEK